MSELGSCLGNDSLPGLDHNYLPATTPCGAASTCPRTLSDGLLVMPQHSCINLNPSLHQGTKRAGPSDQPHVDRTLQEVRDGACHDMQGFEPALRGPDEVIRGHGLWKGGKMKPMCKLDLSHRMNSWVWDYGASLVHNGGANPKCRCIKNMQRRALHLQQLTSHDGMINICLPSIMVAPGNSISKQQSSNVTHPRYSSTWNPTCTARFGTSARTHARR